MAILLSFMTISLLGSFFVVRTMSQNILSSEKANKLLLTASLLDIQLGERSYEDILLAHGAEDASREEKIAVLNRELSAFGDSMTEFYPDLGIGYYSLELEAILTYAPSEQYKSTIGVPIAADHPGRIVMQNNEPMVRTGTMVRGNIMNAMHPISRNGIVIGYAWANELASSIETEYRTTSTNILLVMSVIYIVSVGMAFALSRRSMRDIATIVKGVRMLRSDLSRTIPKAGGDLGEVVDSINAMAADILKAQDSHKALLLAEASNLAQRDFLARMSHEIRTPMNGVLGMTQLAQNAKTEAQRMEYLGKIHASASLLLGIINDILDISKIEAGKMEIEAHAFKFMDTIDNIRDLMTPRTDEKNLALVISVEDSVPEMVVGDSLRISQILFNIVGNAVKFTQEGSVTLRVSAQEAAENKLQLNFSVEDTGIGMDDQQQQAVFKSFTQADSSTARKFGGSGLGLSISKALIELMGGEIGVTSTLSKGSTFRYTIFAENYEGGEEQELDEQSAAAPLQSYEGFTVLLVEDNEINQEIAKAILEDMGLTVDIANDGREGVAAFEAKTYDLIFMDIRMPVMDGIEATQEIREIERKSVKFGYTPPHTPIIAITANVMQADRDATSAVGMDGHISKPIVIEEIRAILKKMLRE
jgi:Signal transduction histidine kinase